MISFFQRYKVHFLLIVVAFAAPSILSHLFRGLIRALSTSRDDLLGDVPFVAEASSLHLHGTRALVVGGTSGIGRGIALTLARAGASVSVVGRNTKSILRKLADVQVSEDQKFAAYSKDLSTVAGGQQLGNELKRENAVSFDHVYFTVGMWPNYSDPHTDDGVQRVVALDLLSHHVVLSALLTHGLLRPGARVMNTIASAQNFPFQSREVVQARLQDATNTTIGPGMVPFMLFPVAIAGDAYLRAMAQRHPGVLFTGMFPGIVMTDLPHSTFPSWLLPILKAALWPVACSEETSGLAHVTVLASENVGRRNPAFFNNLLEGRHAHSVALDDDLSNWVYAWLERCIQGILDSRGE